MKFIILTALILAGYGSAAQAITCTAPWTESNGVCVSSATWYPTSFGSPICGYTDNEFGYNYVRNNSGNEDQCVPRSLGDGSTKNLDCSALSAVGEIRNGMYVTSVTQIPEAGQDSCQFTATLSYSEAKCTAPYVLSGQWSSTKGLCVLDQIPTASQVCTWGGGTFQPTLNVDYFSNDQDECSYSGTNVLTAFDVTSNYLGKSIEGMTVFSTTQKIQKGPDAVILMAIPHN